MFTLDEIAKELERIYGIQNGGNHGNQYKVADSNNFNLLTQSELAAKLGMTVQTLHNYKRLAEMIPEFYEKFRNFWKKVL